MVWPRAAPGVLAVVAAGLAVASGGSGADPQTPPALPGMPAPFLGTAVVGSGGVAAAVDAYGDVVDLRAPGPAGRALIDTPADRQAAGSVSPDTGIVPRVPIGGRAALPMWEADSITQRYLPGTNVLRTVAVFPTAANGGRAKVVITDAARGGELARSIRVDGPRSVPLAPALSISVERSRRFGCQEERRGRELALLCSEQGAARGSDHVGHHRVAGRADRVIATAAATDRRWLARARPLGTAAPTWARRMYRRSLLTLRGLTDRRTGAVAAGLRDGWAYVWPRDAATVAMALAASGYRGEARGIARFLAGLDLDAAARFDGNGAPVPGRPAQGDARGWIAVAARVTGAAPARPGLAPNPAPWRNRPDYQEGEPGDYLANAIASQAAADGPKTHEYRGRSAHQRGERRIARMFAGGRGLVRRANDPDSGLDSAAAWAVRPFPLPALFPRVRNTLRRLLARQTRFGITPDEGWSHPDPWTAPTAWSAWSLAALGERRRALRLLADLRRASTPAGALPERIGVRTGIPRSTTPLAWSHALAILALRQLWPAG